jgi:hypothetical protein
MPIFLYVSAPELSSLPHPPAVDHPNDRRHAVKVKKFLKPLGTSF